MPNWPASLAEIEAGCAGTFGAAPRMSIALVVWQVVRGSAGGAAVVDEVVGVSTFVHVCPPSCVTYFSPALPTTVPSVGDVNVTVAGATGSSDDDQWSPPSVVRHR